MTIKELNAIRETEEKAEETIKKSLSDARQIVSDEENNSYIYLEQALEEEDRKSLSLIKKAEDEAETEAVKIIEHAQHQSNLVLTKAGQNFNKAVDFVIERIVNI